MRNTIMKFFGVAGLLLAAACSDQVGDDENTTQPDDGALAVDGCKVAGCSDEMCIEEGDEVYTSCEWKEEYVCYQSATCGRQADGQCNWIPTPQLQACLIQHQVK